jgi:hypothetical protein
VGELTLSEIMGYVKTYVYEKSPGTYMILDLNSKKKFGISLTDALIKKPIEIYDMIKSLYQDDITARFVFKSLLVKPIAIKLGKLGNEDEVEKALLSGCDAFVEYLKENGVDSNLDKSICHPATGNEKAISSFS